jgi:predicted metal-dependent TIM-barrel fold hydrolase
MKKIRKQKIQDLGLYGTILYFLRKERKNKTTEEYIQLLEELAVDASVRLINDDRNETIEKLQERLSKIGKRVKKEDLAFYCNVVRENKRRIALNEDLNYKKSVRNLGSVLI